MHLFGLSLFEEKSIDVDESNNNFFPELWFEGSDIDFDLETDQSIKRMFEDHQLPYVNDLEHLFTDDFWEIVNEDLKFHS